MADQKFEFEKSQLLAALETVKGAVSNNNLIPILQHVHFKDDTITAYNRMVGVIADFDSGGLECLIPFQRFYGLVKSVKSEKVQIRVSGNEMFIKAGKSDAKLNLMETGDFPEFPDIQTLIAEEGWDVPDNFVEGLKSCLPFVGKDTSRPDLGGVYVEGSVMYGSDARRIVRYDMGDALLDGSVILSADTAKVVSAIGTDQMTVYLDNDRSIFGINSDDRTGAIIFGAVIQADYPNVEKYFPEVGETFELPKAELKEGLKRVGDFMEEAQENKFCVIEFGDTLKVSYEGHTAEIREMLAFGTVLTEKPFSINPYHFAVVLDKCEKFCFIESNSRGVLYGESDSGDFKAILAVKR
jgi:DNA polymerase III sliding clamp (beta) subunit (PCNA family)